MTPEELILAVDKMLRELSRGDFWKRIRIAVSPEEYEAFKKYAFERDGKFFFRVRGVPIGVERDPTAPELYIEYAHD